MTAQACDKTLITFEAKPTRENKNPTYSKSYFANFAALKAYFLSFFLSQHIFSSFLNANIRFVVGLWGSPYQPSPSLAQPEITKSFLQS